MKNLILLISLCMMSTPLFAQTIEIVAENYPPYGYEENSEIKGLSTDIVRYILKDTGIKASSWNIVPWARAYLMAKEKPNILLYTVVRKPDRENLFHWVGPVSDRNIFLFKLKKRKDIVVKSLEEIKKKQYVIGTVINTAATQYLKSLELRVCEVPNYEQNVRMLLKNRTELVVFSEYSLAFLAKKAGSSYLEFEKVLLVDGSKKYYLVLQKDSSKNVVRAFQKSFNQLKTNGGLEKIQSSYLQ